MAPEYVMRGKLSVKVDVYSFGVQVLEIVTGRKSTDINFPSQMDSLLEWHDYCGLRICDVGMETIQWRKQFKVSEVNQEQRCIHVGLLCVQADATLRPAMSNVIMMLSRRNANLPNPSKPAFVSSSKSHASTSKSSWEVEENEKRMTYQISGQLRHLHQGFVQ
ncbi:cysteine-rich receptor-like protein kinase 26 [Cryptomeria japonica]|uniref:cysteine-rich receptor-like protein kinase 26 n=1 Tax=Cryptomeria japonica TaxID=3369 RepID=UPI0027DA34CF|nr:cysteine-rich receptor-like protein kinase 26 [Cryptomeria japonica]